jgi:hypothetical protein
MYRPLPCFFLTLSLTASAIAFGQQPESKPESKSEFVTFPHVRFTPIDFQRLFHGLPPTADGPSASTPTATDKSGQPVEAAAAGSDLSTNAVAVDPQPEPKPEFLTFPQVQVSPLDFEKAGHRLPGTGAGLSESTPTATDKPGRSVEATETGADWRPHAVALDRQPEAEPELFAFPQVQVSPFDFEQAFHSLLPSGDGLSESMPMTNVMPVASMEVVEAGPAAKDVVVLDDAELPTQQPVAEMLPAPPTNHCQDCGPAKSCQCRSTPGFCGRIRDRWRRTHLYRLHVQNLGNPCLFCERPFGVCNEGFSEAMIAAGKADRAILHDYDFTTHRDGSVRLTSRGRLELQRIAGLMLEYPVWLTIESTLHPVQDAARQTAVVNEIAQLGLAIPPDRIRIAVDQTIGLSGQDAQAINAIRVDEAVTGATRTRPYRDASGATLIPVLSRESR